jgi:hypothetical protein
LILIPFLQSEKPLEEAELCGGEWFNWSFGPAWLIQILVGVKKILGFESLMLGKI